MKIDQITFTRFLAAVSIVVFHYGRDVFPFNQFPTLIGQANIGVSYFFILSGFVMMVSYGNKDRISPLEYYKNRFARIYPVYLIGLLAILPIRVLIYGYFALFTHFAMLQSWFPQWVMEYNFPGWSVSVELVFYLMFPFLYNYLYTKGQKVYLPIIVIWVVSQVIFHYMYYRQINLNLIFYSPVLHINEFLVGNMAGMLLKRFKKGNYDIHIVLTVGLMLLALRYSFCLNYHNGLLAVLFVPFILLLSLNTGSITKILSKKPFIFLGEISYSLYIYQFPVFYWLPGDFYIKITALILFSSLSYIFIETPLRKWIRNL